MLSFYNDGTSHTGIVSAVKSKLHAKARYQCYRSHY